MTSISSKIETVPLQLHPFSLDKETARKKNACTELFHNAVSIQAFDFAEQITQKDLDLDDEPSPTRLWLPIDIKCAVERADVLMNKIFNETEKNHVYGHVYALSKNPNKGGPDWGKIHAKDDLRIYVAASMLVEKKLQLEKVRQELCTTFSPHKISDFLEIPNLKNYSQINHKLAVSEIDQKLGQKSQEELNEFYGIIYELSPEPKGGKDWGKIHAKNDLEIYVIAYMQFELQKRRARFNLIKQFIPPACNPIFDFSTFKRTNIATDVKEVNRQLVTMSHQDKAAFHDLINRQACEKGIDFYSNNNRELYVKTFMQFNLERAAARFQLMKNFLSEVFDERATLRLFNQCLPVLQFLNGETETPKLEDLMRRRMCFGTLLYIKKLLIQKYTHVPCMYQACKKIEFALIGSESPFPEADRALKVLQAIYEENYSYHEAQSSFRMLVNTTGKIVEKTVSNYLNRKINMQDMQKHYFHEFNNASLRGIHVVKNDRDETVYRYKSFKKGEFPINAQREVLSYYIDELIDSANALPTAVPKLYSPFIPQNGTLQVWAKNSNTALNVYKTDRNKILECSKLLIHHNALIALIKGRGDGHLGNTLFQFGIGGEISEILDCDDECSLPWENHKMGYVRMWILGHPQCEKPFDRATLMHFSNEHLYNGIIRFADAYKPEFHENKRFSNLPPYDALKERLRIIQEKMKEALEKDQPLTARDLFFALYGAKEIYEQKKSEGMDPILIFNYFLTRGSHLSNQLMPVSESKENVS